MCIASENHFHACIFRIFAGAACIMGMNIWKYVCISSVFDFEFLCMKHDFCAVIKWSDVYYAAISLSKADLHIYGDKERGI